MGGWCFDGYIGGYIDGEEVGWGAVAVGGYCFGRSLGSVTVLGSIGCNDLCIETGETGLEAINGAILNH